MVNKCIFVGNLGADPDLRYTGDGKPVANFRIAVTGGKKDSTEWISAVAWEKTAELAGQYLRKGSKVYVEGRLQTRQWEDKEGNTRYQTEVVVERIQFLDSKRDSETRREQEDAPPPSNGKSKGRKGRSAPPPPLDDDIPF